MWAFGRDVYEWKTRIQPPAYKLHTQIDIFQGSLKLMMSLAPFGRWEQSSCPTQLLRPRSWKSHHALPEVHVVDTSWPYNIITATPSTRAYVVLNMESVTSGTKRRHSPFHTHTHHPGHRCQHCVHSINSYTRSSLPILFLTIVSQGASAFSPRRETRAAVIQNRVIPSLGR